jgi:hypothetical protein
MTIPPHSRRTAKPCPFKAFRHPLTSAVSILARPSLNPFPCYIFPPTGGRVPPFGVRELCCRFCGRTIEANGSIGSYGLGTEKRERCSRTPYKPARLGPFDSDQGKRQPLHKNGAGWASPSPTKNGARIARRAGHDSRHWSPLFALLSLTSRQYCAPIAHPLPKTEPIRIPASCGNPPNLAGMPPLTHRCPDAHD